MKTGKVTTGLTTERDVAQQATDLLRARWPRRWQEPVFRIRTSEPRDRGYGFLVELELPSEPPIRIAVEIKERLPASQAEQVASRLRDTDADARLVVSRWLNAATREVLEAADVNYVDLTGNVSFALDRPRLAIQTHGADRDPDPRPPSTRGLRGAGSWRLARTLADVRPPYSVSELGQATGLSMAFVSRVLEGLKEEGIIDRHKRGPVMSVSVGRLVQRWARDYTLLGSNEAFSFVLPQGPRDFENRLMSLSTERWAVSGSLAAAQLAPIAGPALGVAYVDRPWDVATELGLLPTDTGANVVLVRPFDPIVYRRRWTRNGVAYVSPAQIAVDCLTGTGRMPNEGEALLQWMTANEPRWRFRSLEDERSPLDQGRTDA